MDGMSGWIAFGALLVCCMAAAVVLLRRKKRRRERLWRLHEEIQGYLEGGKAPEFSVEDEELAVLRNDVADLAAELEQARDHQRAAAQQSAGLIADISHQLKTPLAGMRLYCEMDAESGSAGAKKQLELIDRMERLVLGLLRLEKLRANAYEMRFAPGDLALVCREQAQVFRRLYPGKKITLEGGPGWARFDALWMGEAIGNILKNACEHTGEGGRVELRLSCREDFVWLSVSDDGGGVPEAKLPTLFSRFCRVEPGKGNGSGLGLAITRSIMENHHGGAVAENTGEGLRVSVYMPLIEGQMTDMSLH